MKRLVMLTILAALLLGLGEQSNAIANDTKPAIGLEASSGESAHWYACKNVCI